MIILLYDTESKSRNVLASPLGEEGHVVAKGCTIASAANDTALAHYRDTGRREDEKMVNCEW